MSGLPGMDGYQVVKHLRALPNMQPMVVAALTGYGEDRDREPGHPGWASIITS